MQPPSLPTEVHIKDASQTVLVTWDDAHTSTYPWWYLRGFCPCATCQGHGNQTHFIPHDAPALTVIQEVGNYALNIVWDETHTTGIYSFEYLRTLCPCASCRSTLGQSHFAHRLPDAERVKLES